MHYTIDISQSSYEVEEYLISLKDIRKNLLVQNYETIKDDLKDIKKAQKVLEELKPHFSLRQEYVSEVENKFLGKIDHLVGLKNSIEAAKLINKAQALFKAIKQIHLTLNPLVLSTILRENKDVLNWKDEFEGIPEIEKRFDWITKVSDDLKSNTEKRFNQAFETKDAETMKSWVQIFNNMDILNDKIQALANNVLRILFTKWKAIIGTCYEKIGTSTKKEEEVKFLESQFKDYSNEVCKYTLKMYSLCTSLRERNARSYETLEETLQDSGLNNLFNLFWNRVCRIYSQTISKLAQNNSGEGTLTF